MAELPAKRPKAAGKDAAQPTIQAHLRATETPASQPQAADGSSAAKERETRLYCKPGESLAALQAAGMLAPAPADSNSAVWFTGEGQQQGVCIMSKERVVNKKRHGVICVHKLDTNVIGREPDGICGATFPLSRNPTTKSGSLGAVKTSDMTRHCREKHNMLSKKKVLVQDARQAAHAGHDIFTNGSSGSAKIRLQLAFNSRRRLSSAGQRQRP